MGSPRHPWLAMGMLITQQAPPFRRRSPSLDHLIAWRYVSTRAEHALDPAYVVVACPEPSPLNGTAAVHPSFQFACFCKTTRWFALALRLFPRARFLGKMEADSAVHDARLLAELRAAPRLASASPSPRLPPPPQPAREALLWLGHFEWAAHPASLAPRRARYCGGGDGSLRGGAPCGAAARGEVIAPFASGGLDVRSRALAERLAACDSVWEHVRRAEPSRAAGACDGLQGFFAARCLAASGDLLRRGVLLALHLPASKFHRPAGRAPLGPREHTTLLHPDKRCLSDRWWYRHAKPADRDGWCGSTTPSFKWNEGLAILPFPFRVDALQRSDGSQLLTWQPMNGSMMKQYVELQASVHASKLCELFPCGSTLSL
ncbi:hypothetical protein AB1Y20_018531 [Prymnesium parvum]|uniref:Hexosyltransferase n=1 Tax=Prymnesium parvum TaxID=97485 RepID=A0AB34JQ75_PRYPA